MMNSFTSRRVAIAAVGCVVMFAGAGCDFLGFGSTPPTTVSSADDNDPEQNDPEQNSEENYADHSESSAELLLDEEVELINGYSNPVEVDVPADAYSIAVSITEGEPSRNYMVTDWQAPNDFQMVPAGWENDDGQVCYPGCNLRIMKGVGAFGAIAPNNPDAEPGIQPGTHEFTVHSGAVSSGGMFLEGMTSQTGTETARVTVYAELVDDAVPEAGVMDLNLFFTGAEGWTADNAADDPELEAVIDEINEIYSQVNIEIGEIAYHDVEGDYRIVEDLFSGTGDLSQLFAQSENAELEGPSLFFVDELQSPMDGMGGGGVLGISGGIPGPMIVDGSPRSGVAVATQSSQGMGAPGIAKVSAHELGHYLGLFHTSEHFGGFGGQPAHDPLPDTAPDDESYLMHAGGTGDVMSEWQGRVMRKNAWVNPK